MTSINKTVPSDPLSADLEAKCDVHTLWAIESNFAFLETELLDNGGIPSNRRRVSFIAELDLQRESSNARAIIRELKVFCEVITTQNSDLLAVAPFVILTIKFEGIDEAITMIRDVLSYCVAIEISSAVAPPYMSEKSSYGVRNLPESASPPKSTGPSALIAIIDDAIPYKSSTFKQRFLSIWNQETNTVLGEVAIKALSETDDFYDIHSELTLARGVSHGAHMLSIIADPMPLSSRVAKTTDSSPSWECNLGTTAATCPIVGIQLPRNNVEDTSGRWLGAAILNALHYVCKFIDEGDYNKVVVSLSYGHTTGPHDGSTLIERAMDAICQFYAKNQPPKLYIAIPAGNSFSAQSFAVNKLEKGASKTFGWRVLPDGRRATFMELWFDKKTKANEVEILLAPPNGQAVIVEVSKFGKLEIEGNAVGFFRIHQMGEGNVHLLLAIAPTDVESGEASSPHGEWLITVRNLSERTIVHRAYAARSTPHMSFRRNGTLSYFVDGEYDENRYLRALEGDPAHVKTTVLRRGTINGLASGKKPIVASGYRLSDQGHVVYSSVGDGYSDGHANIAYPTDESRALPGIRAGGNAQASAVRLVGTSTAAPQLARAIINAPVAYTLPTRYGIAKDPKLTTQYGPDGEVLMPLS